MPNGLALCSLHHGAFDANILGVTPDYRIEIREDVRREKDGPMLIHGLQTFHGAKIELPSRRSAWPRPEFLEEPLFGVPSPRLMGSPPGDALFVDFESLQEPLSPAILGILKVEQGAPAFEQIVLASRLATAAIASRHIHFSAPEAAFAALADSALPIVGWSLFDRAVVDSLPIAQSVKRAWADRYVNALAAARTWRTRVHPTFKIIKESNFDAKHTLDKYAELAGYSDVDALRGATPAKWIRHVTEQIEKRGHYRRITPEAKRDWHRLLKYNRHDCLALRHVYEKASFELAKWREYEKTMYCVEDRARPVCCRLGSRNARLDALLEKYRSDRWAFLTAWNPGSQPLPRAENDRRQTELIEALAAAGYRCLRGEGRGSDPSWPPEESVLALDIPKRIARRFGRQFGQLAIVAGHRGFASRLVACE